MVAICCISTLLINTACQSVSGYPTAPISAKSEIPVLKQYLTSDVIANYIALSGSGADAQRAYRDEVVDARMRVIDINFDNFREQLNIGYNVTEVGADVAALGLGAAGTLTGAAGTKAILAAIATGVAGTRTSIDKNLYYQKTITALISQMEAGRKAVKVRVETGLGNPVSEYSLITALSDVDDYYDAGSIPSAVNSITLTSGSSQAVSDTQISAAMERRAQ